MNKEEILRLVIKNFLRDGGVMLASNCNTHIIGVKGDIDTIAETLAKALVGVSMTIIKKNPRDFRILVAVVVTHLLAIARIVEIEHGAPQLAEQTARLVAEALRDKDMACHAAFSVKHMMEELEKEA